MSSNQVDVILSPVVTDRAGRLLDVAAVAADAGAAGLWLPEHTHIPVSHPRSAEPGAVAPQYRRLLDPYVSLAAVGTRYPTLGLGTCLSLAGQHHPAYLAKVFATLDVLCAGRLTIGIGFGWLLEEFEAHGHRAEDRVAVTEEVVEIMTSLWSKELTSYTGQHLNLAPTWSGPRPLQRPRPPILLGAGAHDATFRRIARWADGWIAPLRVSGSARLSSAVADLREAWSRAGRVAEPHVALLARLGDVADVATVTVNARKVGARTIVLTTFEPDRKRLRDHLDMAITTVAAA